MPTEAEHVAYQLHLWIDSHASRNTMVRKAVLAMGWTVTDEVTGEEVISLDAHTPAEVGQVVADVLDGMAALQMRGPMAEYVWSIIDIQSQPVRDELGERYMPDRVGDVS